jgi:Carboxypeptidase regulatory-like domain/TonB dependent receptor-like, beta-barrel
MKDARLIRIFVVTTGILLLLVALATAQSGRGTISGVIHDASGAVVPNAEVAATNKGSGVETKTTTTATGVYRMPYVPPGIYKITVTMSGFKTAIRDNVEVLVAQTVNADFSLELGEVTQEVTVSAEAPLLEASSPEIGTNSTELEVHTWPIQVGDGTRGLQTFIFTSMPGTQGGEWQGSINGSQSFSHEVLIDGISLGRFDINGGGTSEFTATMDAVSEFKLQTGAISAQYGNTQTGLANFGMKSGTNEFHGTAFWFHQNSALNANGWADNSSGRLDPETGKAFKPSTRLNNGGATFGGPIRKDKTHFFFSFETNKTANQVLRSSFRSSPTAEMKRGDFSRLFDPKFTEDPRSGRVLGKDALGRDVRFGQIYDPLSTRQLSDGTWVRDPFPGNVIPQDRFSAVTKKILNPLYALPDPTFPRRNLTSDGVPIGETLRNNTLRVSGCCPDLRIKNYSIKIDHVVNANHKVSGSFTENDRYRFRYGGGSNYDLPGPIPNTPAAGDKRQDTPGWLVRFAEDWTISPSKLNHFAYGYNRFRNKNVSNTFNSGKDWASELGFQGVGGSTFPVIAFAGANNAVSGSYLRWGHSGTGNEPNGSNIVSNDFTWIKGSHSLRIGGEHRRYYINSRFADTPGTYNFNSDQTALSGFAQNTGFAFASFILGTVRNSGVDIHGITQAVRTRTTAFYVQDDWKISSKLTVNLGVRWDIPTGYTNPTNTMSGLDPSVPNPGADNFPGALVFLGDCKGCNGKTRWADIYYKEFAPRVGFAYAVNEKLVVRGGYGINYAPPLLDAWAFGWWTGFDGANNIVNKTGRPGGGNDFAYRWDSPYPKYTGSLPNYDPTQLNDDSIPYYDPATNKYPKTQNWNFGVQYELPWKTKLEVNYVGTRGTRLNDAYRTHLQELDPKYLSLGDTLTEDIDLHPEFKKPFPSFSGTVGQSLMPFPQYRGITSHRTNEGWSNYHSMQVTATKRVSNGLSFLVAYTFSKSLASTDDAIGYYGGYGQSIYNRRADYSVTSLNVPQDLRITWIYDLPFGKNGRWLKSGVVSSILGGWTMSAIQNYRSGGPLSITNSGGPDTGALANTGFYADVLLPRDQQVIGSKPSDPDRALGNQYLNLKAFGAVPVTDNNIPLRFGNGTRFLPNLRGFARGGESFSLMKRTPLGFREGASFEIRADITNLFNRTWISDPETDIGDPERFGRVFNKYGGGRVIQLGARINF